MVAGSACAVMYNYVWWMVVRVQCCITICLVVGSACAVLYNYVWWLVVRVQCCITMCGGW